MNGISLWIYEMRAALRRPAPLFLSFFIPLLVLSLIAVSIYRLVPQDDENIRAAIVDLDQTFETKSLVNQLSEDEEMKKALTLVPMSADEARTSFRQGDLAGIITIPKGFSGSLRVGENESIQVVTNREQPLSSSMIRLLLDSGAMYISASQSAVNTVYDLHITNLENNKERNQKLQQSILTFTLFALSRNDAFAQEVIESGSQIGWKAHAIVALLLTIICGFSIIFQWMDSRYISRGMMLRLRSFHITEVQLSRVQWGKAFVLITLAGLLYWAGAMQLDESLSTESAGIIVFGGAFLASLITFAKSTISHAGMRSVILFVLIFLGLGAGGVWVPSIYLPDGLGASWNPFALLYQLLAEHIMGESISKIIALKMILWIFVLLGLGIGFAMRKERRHAYVSVSERS